MAREYFMSICHGVPKILEVFKVSRFDVNIFAPSDSSPFQRLALPLSSDWMVICLSRDT